METTVNRRGRGRPATGATTTTIRIPIPLKPAIEKFVREYHRTVAEVHKPTLPANEERQL